MELRPSVPITVRDHQTESTRNLQQLIRMLAGLDARPQLVVSLTLDTRWRDEQQRQRVRLFLRDEGRKLRAKIPDEDLATIVAADLLRLEAIVEERIRAAGPAGGLALYLCGPADLELELATWQPLPMRMAIAPVPMVRPLVEAMREPPFALVVACEAAETRIYRLGPDGTDLSKRVEGQVPRRMKAGGWSQMNMQHERAYRIDEGQKDAIAAIERLLDEVGGCDVFLAGGAEAIGHLERQLPSRVRERVVRLEGPAVARDDGGLGERVAARTRTLMLERGTQRVGELEGRVAEGRAAVGAEAVARALDGGQVATLLLATSTCLDGWSCPSCGTVGIGAVDKCTACEQPVDTGELGEAMCRRAIDQGADIEILDEATGIGRYGVAAELRYPTVH